MTTSCTQCGRDGFKWNKKTCFYCGYYDENRELLSDAAFKARHWGLVDPSEKLTLPISKSSGIRCNECGREGFLWNRSYCSYCGQLSKELKDLAIDDDRISNDKLYDEEYRRFKGQRDSLNSYYDTSTGGLSSGSYGDSFGGNDCGDSGGSCNE